MSVSSPYVGLLKALNFLKDITDIALISGHLFLIILISDTSYRHVMLLFGKTLCEDGPPV
jgi:hypothetical protein